MPKVLAATKSTHLLGVQQALAFIIASKSDTRLPTVLVELREGGIEAQREEYRKLPAYQHLAVELVEVGDTTLALVDKLTHN